MHSLIQFYAPPSKDHYMHAPVSKKEPTYHVHKAEPVMVPVKVPVFVETEHKKKHHKKHHDNGQGKWWKVQ